jgi:DNA ligase-1
MRRFTELYLSLDSTTRTSVKTDALAHYFATAAPLDAAWATFFLTGHKLKRVVGTRDLVAAALQASGVTQWLFEASYAAVGDLAETIALLLPPPAERDDRSLAAWVDEEIAPMAGLPSAEVQARLRAAWRVLDRDERFVFGKLLTGAFRVGAARQLVYRALAQALDVPVTDVAHRLVGAWTPSPAFVDALREAPDARATAHRPYPFFLAHALQDAPESLGDVAQWQAEWKWDGIRAQVIVRADGASVWSRGEELVTSAFPEVADAARVLPPGTVIDGELIAWAPGASVPLPFASLQQRLNRKAPGAKLQRDVPVVMIAYDVLEAGGEDIRARALRERRALLEALLPVEPTLKLSPTLAVHHWSDLDDLRSRARDVRAEGIMLKRLDAPYGVGRVRGPWWKWKIDPYTIDAVLVYAQPGSGRRASLLTDYTFAVHGEDGELVAFAKAYSGLSDAEIRAVDNWIRNHTLERFGPVRRVEPVQVFELAFEGLQISTRHKSGVATRFPRIARWRKDKAPGEADTLQTLKAMASRHAGEATVAAADAEPQPDDPA